MADPSWRRLANKEASRFDARKSAKMSSFLTSAKLSYTFAAGLSSGTQEQRTRANLALNGMESDSRRFAEGDRNADQLLSFDEFIAMLPPGVRKRFGIIQLRSWFDEADVDNSGSLSVGEYFKWTLRNAVETHGYDVLRTIFQRYDRDGSGSVTLREFQTACDDIGFGFAAMSIFRMLDPDRSGSIEYSELTQSLESLTLDTQAKQMLASLTQSYNSEASAESQLLQESSANWRLRGHSVAEVRKHMRQLLTESGAHVIDIMEQFDVDGSRDRQIDAPEFYTAMRTRFHYKGPLGVIDGVFASLDTDGSGSIGFDELYALPIATTHATHTTCRPLPLALGHTFHHLTSITKRSLDATWQLRVYPR